jgi:DNA-directed RNA polymerase specialized sigma24 family protein
MSDPGSVTLWIERLQSGDRDVVQQLWERYFQQLVGMARMKLQGLPRAAADEEDVALSAFQCFCQAAAQGRFPQLADRHDLWTVLMLITNRKACELIEHQQRMKRDWRKTLPDQVGTKGALHSEEPFVVQLIGKEPDPAFAVEMADCCRQLLSTLKDEQLRAIALWKLEGYTNEEIAVKINCALATVERRLSLIRELWWEKRPR